MSFLNSPTTSFVLVLLFVIAGVMAKRAQRRPVTSGRATGDLRARQPLTEREQAMYFRLTQALPEYVVLAQVAFSALLDTKDRPTRATFDRKVADFVVCTKAFEIAAVIELDDASHRGREEADAARNAMLERVAYRVLRFKNVPDAEALRKALIGRSEPSIPKI